MLSKADKAYTLCTFGMGIAVDLRQLRNFLVVVEQRNISRAASLLRLAQPALSRQLRALEEDLGHDLLVRHGWGVTATPEGEILVEHAKELLRNAQAAREALGIFSKVPSGRLAVGVPSSMAAVILPRLALEGQTAFPKIELKLVEGYSANLHRRTLAGDLDLAILYSEPHFPALVHWPLLSEPLVVIGPPGRFRPDSTLSVADVAKWPLLLPASSNRLRVLFEAAAARSGVMHRVLAEVDSVPALLELVGSGCGVSVLPYSTVRPGLTQGILSAAFIGPEPLNRELVLARPRDRPETPVWKSIAGLLCEILARGEGEFRWTMTLPGDF